MAGRFILEVGKIERSAGIKMNSIMNELDHWQQKEEIKKKTIKMILIN
jgi:hypothetical protein